MEAVDNVELMILTLAARLFIAAQEEGPHGDDLS